MLQPSELYGFGDYRLDATGRVLFRGNQVVGLSPKQIDTLIILVRAGGSVVDRDRLVREVWPDSFVEDGALSRNISILRKTLEGPDGQPLIETLPKRGYRFIPRVHRVADEQVTMAVMQREVAITVVEEVETSYPVTPQQLDGGRARSKLVPGLAAIAAMVVVIVGGVLAWQSSTVSPGFSVRTLAVLPFRQVGAEPQDSYLGFGLADVLTARFSNLASMSVVPTGRTLALTGHEPIAAGRSLSVDAVLDGTIQKQGDRYRVIVQLLSVATGHVMWAGTFDERGKDLWLLEDRVADSVASLLAPRLAPEERRRIAKQSTRNPDAWRAYLRGRALWATRDASDIEQAIAAFDSAIAGDPGFALAYAGLAQALIAQGGYQYRWPAEVYPRARLAAIRAIELDGALADAHGAFAAIAWVFDRDFTTAAEEFRLALALNPLDSTLHQFHASYLAAMGRHDDALAAIDRAIALDPQGFTPNYEKVRILFYARRFEDSIQYAERVLRGPGSTIYAALAMSIAHDLLGRRHESIEALQRAALIAGDIPSVVAFTARYAGRDGRRSEALKLIRYLEAQRSAQYVDPIFIAGAYLGLDDFDSSLHWLRQTVEDRSVYASYLAVDPVYAKFHDEPRFQAIVRSAGLAGVLRP
jgi:DNA-binding winged helix-turn-helix (wHTH) protein/TolB-like protein/Tfp pilus assembly protein PilF